MIYIDTNIKNLTLKFNEIKKMGWIESKRKGTTGIGYTFESLLNKKEDNFELPDYEQIEIKTKHKYSKGFITLFNANPDGDYLFSISKLHSKYGYPDKVLSNCLVFQGSILCKVYNMIGPNYRFSIKADDENNKLDLLIIDRNNNLIDEKISWTYNLLKEKLERKLQFLAIIKADSKKINGVDFFKYSSISIYQLHNFETFLNLIKQGKIRITFKIGVFKTGKRKGAIHNHGVGFDINESNLSLLYKKLN